MIIIGFPGIGKSTLSQGLASKYLDLDSSLFNFENRKISHWEVPYVRTAEYLSKKGFDVFVSSHEEVVHLLEYSSEMVVVCYPSLELKDEWVTKLKQRYLSSHLPAHKRAARRIAMHYTEYVNNIAALAQDCQFPAIVIESMEYNLEQRLKDILSI